jgi:hypothetical protein
LIRNEYKKCANFIFYTPPPPTIMRREEEEEEDREEEIEVEEDNWPLEEKKANTLMWSGHLRTIAATNADASMHNMNGQKMGQLHAGAPVAHPPLASTSSTPKPSTKNSKLQLQSCFALSLHSIIPSLCPHSLTSRQSIPRMRKPKTSIHTPHLSRSFATNFCAVLHELQLTLLQEAPPTDTSLATSTSTASTCASPLTGEAHGRR